MIHVEGCWVMTPCRDVVGYQRFGAPCFLSLQAAVNDTGTGYIAAMVPSPMWAHDHIQRVKVKHLMLSVLLPPP
jgi:hypothetical protein